MCTRDEAVGIKIARCVWSYGVTPNGLITRGVEYGRDFSARKRCCRGDCGCGRGAREREGEQRDAYKCVSLSAILRFAPICKRVGEGEKEREMLISRRFIFCFSN